MKKQLFFWLGLLGQVFCAWGTFPSIRDGNDRVWKGPLCFEQTLYQGQNQQKVIFTAGPQPIAFSILQQSLFPSLNLGDIKSCQTFMERLKLYVSEIALTRCCYAYKGTWNEQILTMEVQPTHSPLKCSLKGVKLTPDQSLGLMHLKEVYVHVTSVEEGKTFGLDLAPRFQGLWKPVSLPLKSEAIDWSQARLVQIPLHQRGPVMKVVGKTLTYHVPAVMGVQGLEQDKIYPVDYYSSTALPSNILASQILETKQQGVSLSLKMETDEGWSETSSMTTVTDLMLTQGLSLDLEGYQRFEVNHSSEKQVSSPYIFFDGEKFHLTITYEKTVYPYVNGKADREFAHQMQYTLASAIPVVPQGLKKVFPQGLYHYEKGAWWLLDDHYQEQGGYVIPQADHLAQRGFDKGPLFHALSVITFLKEILEKAKDVLPYVTFLGEDRFKTLKAECTDKNFYKILSVIPADENYLLLPLLVPLRDHPNLEDKDFMNGESGSYARPPYTADLVWYDCMDMTYPKSHWNQGVFKIHSAIKVSSILYPQHKKSLKVMGLFPGASDPHDHHGKYLKRVLKLWFGSKNSKDEPIPFGFDQECYGLVADVLRLNNLVALQLSPQYDHEDDTQVTIQDLATAIATSKSLISFAIPRYMGLENIKCLMSQGLSLNHSLKELYFAAEGILDVALLGEVLAHNSSLKFIDIRLCINTDTDLECLNWLGDGLLQNHTLENFSLLLEGYRVSDYGKKHPLPGRAWNTHTQSFDRFVAGLKTLPLKHLRIGNIQYHGQAQQGVTVDFTKVKPSKEHNRYAFDLLKILQDIKAAKPDLSIHVS
jgi:hypothetical protein